MDRGLCLAIFCLEMTVGVGLRIRVESRPPTPTVTLWLDISVQPSQPTRSLVVVLCVPRQKYRLLRGAMCSH